MIGAKAVGSISVAVLGVAAAIRLGLFRFEHLARADAESAFVTGLGAVLAGLFVFRFWRLGETSRHYFRWMTQGELWNDESHFIGTDRWRVAVGTNRGDAFDLSPRAQLCVCIGGAFLLGLATFDARALRMLESWPETVFSAGSDYCPDPNQQAVVEERDPEEPGCALIRRAYALGYAKTLGDCAKRKRSGKTEPATVCHLRQIDEPALHYGWRRLARFGAGLLASADPEQLAASRRELGEQLKLERLEILYGAQQQVLTNIPRSSHHVFTNLPDPGSLFDPSFHPLTCMDRYRELPHRPPAPSTTTSEKEQRLESSRIFEHVLGQLLFDTRYEPPAGYCREYQVHWGLPDDACKQLAADPIAFLDETGALDHVRATFERQRIAKEMHGKRSTTSEASAVPGDESPSFVSFQCWIEGAPAPGKSRVTFSLDGRKFVAEERRVAESKGPLPIDRYDDVSNLLAPRFHYGALHSEAGVETSVQGKNVGLFADREYRLAHLHALAGVDIFLEPESIADRRDLLDVYPYHLHLRNYVHLFRREYLRDRGRL